MGQTLHTFTVLAHTPLIHTGSDRQRHHGHRGWERESCGGGGSDTNMVFYLYVRMGKHRLKWLQRCFRGDTLSVIMTHRPASCHFFPPAGTTCSSRAHKHTHT